MAEGLRVECIEMMDKKTNPVYSLLRKKLDIWIFVWIFFPTVILLAALISSAYDSNAAKIDKYEGMELRITEKIQEVQEKISDKIDNKFKSN